MDDMKNMNIIAGFIGYLIMANYCLEHWILGLIIFSLHMLAGYIKDRKESQKK